MPNSFVHVVLTRFNTRHAWIGGAPGLDPEWLRRRFDLFDAFCYPSLSTQDASFSWFVFFDSETPAALRPRIAAYEALTAFTPIFVEGELTDERIGGFVGERIPLVDKHLITTRVDADDALATDFVRRVQHAFRPSVVEFLNFPLGYQWSKGRIYYHLDPSNPFLSLIERPGPNGPRTIYSAPHNMLESDRPLRQLSAPPMWLQVVHDDNLRNELVGVRRPLRRPPARFHLRARVVEDSWTDRAGELAFTLARQPAIRLRRRRRLKEHLDDLRSRGLLR